MYKPGKIMAGLAKKLINHKLKPKKKRQKIPGKTKRVAAENRQTEKIRPRRIRLTGQAGWPGRKTKNLRPGRFRRGRPQHGGF